jgi:hypothetical protein
MGKKTPSEEVDPLYLPQGTQVGPWHVTGFRGRGAFGTLYRVEQVGREAAGPFALKLAVYPRDPRFEHEAQLLSRIHSPHVPQLIAQDVWEHPSGVYPFLVKQWVDGEPLYEWAVRRNPSEKFVHAFRRHPTAHYPASTCDDLFAMGVMAYRLVTDEYSPSPHREEPGSEVWREGGGGPCGCWPWHPRSASAARRGRLPRPWRRWQTA